MSPEVLRLMAENFLPRSQRPELVEPLVELLMSVRGEARIEALKECVELATIWGHSHLARSIVALAESGESLGVGDALENR
jgi:hypothetical protein